MKTHRFTPFTFTARDNKLKNIFDSKLIRLTTFIWTIIFFGSGIIQAQCPVTDCLPLHVTSVNLNTIPECGVGTVSIQGDIQNGQADCKNGPLNNCHEFVMFRPAGSVTQQFTLEVGQGAGCNGELDATYSFIDGVCDTLSNGGSNTSIVFSFPANVDTITLFLCLNSGAFVTICDLCASPPPCDLLPICNLDPIDTTGCSVPAPFTDPADVFTNIPSCMGTTLILDHEDVGDTSFCMLPAGVDFIRTYTLYFLDAIGDTIEFRECPQSIKIIPVLPVVECQDITVNLNSMGMVSITPQQVLDSSALGCGGTFSVNPDSFTCADLGENTVTLTVTDDCGNTATCTATVTVQTPTPTADAGDASADICITETFTAIATTSNGSILWTTSGTGGFNGTQTTEDATYTPSMSDYTAGTVTLTLTVTGICTTAVDSIVLNFIQCECEVVLICDEDVLRNDSIINGCSAASAPPIISPANSVFDTLSIGGIDCNILYASTTNTTGTLCSGIIVTYTYYGWHDDDLDGIRDPEEQQYSCAEVFTIVDVTAPDITCPASLTIECTASTLPDSTGTATATDNCDTTPTVTSSDVTVGGGCPQEYIITRTWTAVDDCGNSSSCTQTITVDDSMAPQITCPASLTIECTASTLPDSTGTATATDNCDTTPTITSSDVIVGGGCPQEYIITRTWTAVDNCGNSSSCTQTITVEDSMAPQITCPASLTIDCTASTLPDSTGTATATDNCDGTPTITSSDVIVGGSCPQEMIITRTWRASDDCGNSSSCTQVITVEDNVPPEITVCPADTIVNCTSPTDTATLGVLVAEDLCDETLAISYSDVSISGSCPQERTILRTWVATDDCLNSSSCVQTIMVQDTTPPLFTCPTDTIVDCTSLTDTTTLGVLIASDECDQAVTISFADTFVPGSCPQEYTLLRVWAATDDCLNTSTCIQTITVQDTTGPAIVCPANTTLECTASTDPNSTVPGSASATDNCEGPVSVTSNDIIIGGDCAQEYVILRTWTATDECENSSTCLQTITIDDSVPPVLDCPDDLTLDCVEGADYAEIILEWIDDVSATDNCSDSVTIVNNYDGVTIPNFSCTGGLVITFTATDECGNSSTCSITITKPCFELDTWVYLEGAAAHPNGFNTYTLPMRTTLNNLRVLPGQTLVDPFLGIKYTPPGQPYNIAPWNYFGTEGDGYDSGGDPMMGSAGYPSTVVDWVLVSLRNNANDQLNTASCQAAALLHKDGTVEFVEPLSCCNVNENTTYYVVIEHRNHLIVMSHVRVSWVNHKLTYDFRNQQSYVDDPFMFGIYARQKQIITGSFAMFGGNGNQIGNGDTDININDRSFWEGENGEVGEYRRGDYNLNSDTNLNDRVLWERNNGRFTSVPRN